MTDERISSVLKWEKTTKQLFENAKEHGTERLQRGFNVPGCKLVKNRKNAVLKDGETLGETLVSNGASPADVYKLPVIKSPNQLKLSLDKKHHKLIKDNTYTPDGGASIALMEDTRPAIATSKEIFKDG